MEREGGEEVVEGVGGVGGCTICVGGSRTGEGMVGVRGGSVEEESRGRGGMGEEGEVGEGGFEVDVGGFFLSTSGMKDCRMADPLLPIDTFLCRLLGACRNAPFDGGSSPLLSSIFPSFIFPSLPAALALQG